MLPAETSERATFAMKAAMFWCATDEVEREVRVVAGGDEDHDGLADRPRRAEHERGDDPRQRGGEDDAHDDLPLGGAEPEGALAQRLRDRRHRVLGDRRDRRQHEDAEDDPGRQAVEDLQLDAELLLQQRREERQREVAEDDRRDAREHLDDRLEDLAHARRGVLGEVDADAEAERDRDEQRDERQVQRAPDERHDAEGLRLAAGERRPVGAREEVLERDLLEERQRLDDERDDDARRREDGQDRGAGEQGDDAPLADRAACSLCAVRALLRGPRES